MTKTSDKLTSIVAPKSINLPENSILIQLDGGVKSTFKHFPESSRDEVDMMRHLRRVISEDSDISKENKELLVRTYKSLLPRYLISKLVKGLRYSPISITD